MTDISIRLLKTTADMRLVQELERVVWGMDPIPTHQTVTAVKNGGIMLGAFDGAELIGFSYSFPGFMEGQTYLCSHMLGIHPSYQSKGIGKILKDQQLKAAKDLGYDLITWTFDPLESRNAYLNIAKLYGICNTYIENCYGEMEDGLNKGLPTDRFQVTWWITSDRVTKQWTPAIENYENPCSLVYTKQGHPQLQLPEMQDYTAEGIEVPVPARFQSLKAEDPELAIDWRLKTRSIFQQLFVQGYALVGVKRSEDTEVRHYQFIKKNTIPL